MGVKNTYPQAKSASKTRTLRQKVRPTKGEGRARMGVRRELGGGQEGVKNVYPSSKSASKTCTLSQKVGRKRVPLGRKSTSKPRITWDTKMRQKRVPLALKCVENAHP